MRLGILEFSDDEFANNLKSRLQDLNPEFIRPAEVGVPTNWGFRAIVDRISFQNPFLREAVKNMSLHGTYVINNPFSSDSLNKIVDLNICSMMNLPHPKTMALPLVDGDEELTSAPHLQQIAETVGLPCIVKPYNGFAWTNVFTANTLAELENLYEAMKEQHILLVQERIDYQDYYKAFCIGKEVLFIKYIPKKNSWDYIYSDLKPIEGIRDRLEKWTVKLNTALDLDLNAVEWAIDRHGKPFVIDAFNEVPEITRAIPDSYYSWILDKLSNLVREKFHSDERNRTVFRTSPRI